MEWSLLSDGTQLALSNGRVLIKMPYFYLSLFIQTSRSHQSRISRFYALPQSDVTFAICQSKKGLNTHSCYVFFQMYYWELLPFSTENVIQVPQSLLRRNSVFFHEDAFFAFSVQTQESVRTPVRAISYALSRNHQFQHFLDNVKCFLDNSIKKDTSVLRLTIYN